MIIVSNFGQSLCEHDRQIRKLYIKAIEYSTHLLHICHRCSANGIALWCESMDIFTVQWANINNVNVPTLLFTVLNWTMYGLLMLPFCSCLCFLMFFFFLCNTHVGYYLWQMWQCSYKALQLEAGNADLWVKASNHVYPATYLHANTHN